MTPEIKRSKEIKLIGMSLRMSLSEDRTFELWSTFMPRRGEILNKTESTYYCLQMYDSKLNFNDFNPTTIYDKWVMMEVSDFENIPEHMKSYVIPIGLFAVFIHRGLASDFYKTSQYIFGTWLPSSPYLLDNRAHFQVMDERYKRNDPSSEEEVWIPIKENFLLR